MSALRQARTDRGWSQSRTIAELQSQAKTLGVTLPAPSSLKTELSRWENGHRAPDAFYQQLFERVYGRSCVDHGIASADLEPVGSIGGTWEEGVTSAARLWKQDLDRRDFLRSATFVAAGFAAPSLHALVSSAASPPSRSSGALSVGAAQVTLIQEMTKKLAALDNQHGAGRSVAQP